MGLNRALPAALAQRQSLNDEVHARPTEALWPQERVFHIAMVCTPDDRAAIEAHLCWLARDYDIPPADWPDWSDPQISLDLSRGSGALRLRLEKHNEFVSFSFFERADHAVVFDRSAAKRLPPGWLAALPGQMLVAIDLFMHKVSEAREAKHVAGYFEGHTLVGGGIAGGTGQVFTDFMITPSGTTRVLVCNVDMSSRQAGRMVQRIIELETYRMMALLSFPVARDTTGKLATAESELVRLTNEMAQNTPSMGSDSRQELEMDRGLLAQLTDLAARIEKLSAQTRVRFTAAEAYHDLVKKRTDELKEIRTEGMQTFSEFMERRLGPAMRTCAWTARRQSELSERISRATQLLRTRVDIEREAQNQKLLESMDSRARLQLRLQETVEGLSIVAITYYSVSLLGYITKGLKVIGVHVEPELVIAIGIPVVMGASWLSLKAMRKRLGLAH